MDNAILRLLHPQERDLVPILQEAWWAQSLVWTGVENRAPAGFRLLDRPARSKFLYQLSYPVPMKETKRDKNIKIDIAEVVLTIKIRFVSRLGLASRILVVMIVRFGTVKLESILTRVVAVALEKNLLYCLFLL